MDVLAYKINLCCLRDADVFLTSDKLAYLKLD